MCHIENKVLENDDIRPTTYCRYVDDCYLVVRDVDHLHQLKIALENNSVLKFTYEQSTNNRLNFLDVRVDGSCGTYTTSVFKKPTNTGAYLNANSECPERYKSGTITALIHRTYKISSTWELFTQTINELKQTLVNNGYSNSIFDGILKKYLEKTFSIASNSNNNGTTHVLYYRNQMSTGYKTDEKVLKQIIKNNINCNNSRDKLQLSIYYKNSRTSSLVMKNSPPAPADLKRTNVVYQYTCHIENCESHYIGMTTTTLSRRLTMHLRSGAPAKHTEEQHKQGLTRQMLVDSTKIIRHNNDFNRLQIEEALLISQLQPSINRQDTGRVRTLALAGEQPISGRACP
jgi:hypothetical protein